MLQKQIEKLPKAVVEVSMTVPWVDLEAQWNTAVTHVAGEVELPGFRKGQAPLEMVEQKEAAHIQQDFLKNVMPQSLMEALKDTDVMPIDYPQYQIVSFTKGGELVFKARVTSRPVVTVGNYKVIKVTRPALRTVNDEEITKIIDDLFKRYQARTPQAMAGNVPAAGTPDEAFAKAMGANDVTDLRTKIKQDMEANAKYDNELDYEEAILQEVEKITTVDLPDILIQDELNRMLVSLQRQVTERGLLLEEYLKGQNKTVDSIKQEWRPQAEKNVRMELGLSEIAHQEKVAISEEELQAEIDKIQDNRVKQQFEAQEPKEHLRHALRQTKTLTMLKGVVGAS